MTKYLCKETRSVKIYYKIYDVIPDNVPESFKVDSIGCYETCEIYIGLNQHELATCKINKNVIGTKDFINMLPYICDEIDKAEYDKARELCELGIDFIYDLFEKI